MTTSLASHEAMRANSDMAVLQLAEGTFCNRGRPTASSPTSNVARTARPKRARPPPHAIPHKSGEGQGWKLGAGALFVGGCGGRLSRGIACEKGLRRQCTPCFGPCKKAGFAAERPRGLLAVSRRLWNNNQSNLYCKVLSGQITNLSFNERMRTYQEM